MRREKNVPVSTVFEQIEAQLLLPGNYYKNCSGLISNNINQQMLKKLRQQLSAELLLISLLHFQLNRLVKLLTKQNGLQI